jgi:L-ascorbate metabolism protein UlaG (beta-lactamase superfamily)
MQRSRRLFLRTFLAGTTATVAGATWWIASSKRIAARWARAAIADARRSILPAPANPTPATWSDHQITMAWLGHATVLINFYGIHILTDPTLGKRVGVSLGLATAGPKRYVAPPLKWKELPPIDVLLLSHAHMDHMDLPTLNRFANTFTVTASQTAAIIRGTRLKNPHELKWNESTSFKNQRGSLEITAFEVKHWGRRWPNDIERGYNGYVLRREGKAILFGGDTAQTPLFRNLRSKGPFEVALMPIGAYQPWIWNHCTPEQALGMASDAGAKYILPIHHQTFRLSEEPMNEPIERLKEALSHEPERLALSQVGETFVVPAA